MANDLWNKQYDAWQEAARSELALAYPDAMSGHIEICEDGAVYLGNMTWLPAGTVTAWSEA